MDLVIFTVLVLLVEVLLAWVVYTIAFGAGYQEGSKDGFRRGRDYEKYHGEDD